VPGSPSFQLYDQEADVGERQSVADHPASWPELGWMSGTP
jgi:hypothetical protein